MSLRSRIVLVSALIGAVFTLLAAVPPISHLSADVAAAMPTVLDRVAILFGAWSLLALVLLVAGALAFAPRRAPASPAIGLWPVVFALAGLLLLSGVFPHVRAWCLGARYEAQGAVPRIVLIRCGEGGMEGVVISSLAQPALPGDWGPFQRIAEAPIPGQRRDVEVPDGGLRKATDALLAGGLLLRDRSVWGAPRAFARGDCVPVVGIERGRFHYHVARTLRHADAGFEKLLGEAAGLLPGTGSGEDAK